MLDVFRGVRTAYVAILPCVVGVPQRKCITTLFSWDDHHVGDFPCAMGWLPINQSSPTKILRLLQQFAEEE